MSSLAIHTYDALLVDDEPVLRQAMARALKGSGFRCDLATDGRHALQLLSDRRYQVVITDLNMPEMNGHRLAVELLAKPDRPVVIVVTGVTEPKLERDLRARGVDEILFKPVDYAALAARAEALIEARASQTSAYVALPVEVPSEAPSEVSQSVAPAAELPVAVAATSESVRSPYSTLPEDSQPSPPAEAITSTLPAPNPLGATDATVPKNLQRRDTLASPTPERIERLERQLEALSKARSLALLWPALALALGVSLGWLLAMWSR